MITVYRRFLRLYAKSGGFYSSASRGNIRVSNSGCWETGFTAIRCLLIFAIATNGNTRSHPKGRPGIQNCYSFGTADFLEGMPDFVE